MSRFVIGIVAALAMCATADEVYADTCSQYFTSTIAVPSGYAAAYDVFADAHPLLTAVNCAVSTIPLTVGAQDSSQQLIYQFAYLFASNGSSWQQIPLSSTHPLSGVWYPQKATGTLNLTTAQLQDWNYVAFLVAHWTGTKWVFGCADTSCTTPMWSIQAISAQALTPTDISLNVFLKIIPDDSAGGTLIATAQVTMSDGTSCQGPPDCSLTSSNTSLFAIRDLNIILARSLSPADDGSYTMTITAR